MNIQSVIVALFLSFLTVYADYLLKLSSVKNVLNYQFYLAASIYATTALGWFFVMKTMKLSTAGTIYGVSCMILLVLLSVFHFKEELNYFEMVGIVFGIISIVILAKFA